MLIFYFAQIHSLVLLILVKKTDDAIIGVTKAKTDDAVYVQTDEHEMIQAFTRDVKHEYEWANICFIPKDFF